MFKWWDCTSNNLLVMFSCNNSMKINFGGFLSCENSWSWNMPVHSTLSWLHRVTPAFIILQTQFCNPSLAGPMCQLTWRCERDRTIALVRNDPVWSPFELFVSSFLIDKWSWWFYTLSLRLENGCWNWWHCYDTSWPEWKDSTAFFSHSSMY